MIERYQHKKKLYAVEIERGGKCCRVFWRPIGGGPRKRTDIPVLDRGMLDWHKANNKLRGYAKLVGWTKIKV